MPNMILMGQAEEIELVRPEVRKMLADDGVYICRDIARPEFTIPLSVHGGRVFSMVEDSELDPERFLSTAQFHGPYFGDPDTGEHGRLARAAERYHRLRASLMRDADEPRDCDYAVAVALTIEEFDAAVDALPSESNATSKEK